MKVKSGGIDQGTDDLVNVALSPRDGWTEIATVAFVARAESIHVLGLFL